MKALGELIGMVAVVVLVLGVMVAIPLWLGFGWW